MKTLRAIAELICLWILLFALLAAAAWFLAPVDAAMQPQHVFRSTT
jgi:hypothetical protein